MSRGRSAHTREDAARSKCRDGLIMEGTGIRRLKCVWSGGGLGVVGGCDRLVAGESAALDLLANRRGTERSVWLHRNGHRVGGRSHYRSQASRKWEMEGCTADAVVCRVRGQQAVQEAQGGHGRAKVEERSSLRGW